jgi:hypothetical protein
MRALLHSRSSSPTQLLRQILHSWPYLLIAICVMGFAYRFWHSFRR